jgi:serine/threonine protein kinase
MFKYVINNNLNIFNNFILGDFGLSRITPTECASITIELMGTPLYFPPEILKKEPFSIILICL